jgi:hypothetical protein
MVLDRERAASNATQKLADDLAEHLREQTEGLLAASRRLIQEMEELQERARALKAAHDILLASARQEREIRAAEKKKHE